MPLRDSSRNVRPLQDIFQGIRQTTELTVVAIQCSYVIAPLRISTSKLKIESLSICRVPKKSSAFVDGNSGESQAGWKRCEPENSDFHLQRANTLEELREIEENLSDAETRKLLVLETFSNVYAG